jgi:hypothetical protein
MTSDELMLQFRETIEEELYPYGSYLAMRGAKEGEQRFGVPEIALATLAVLAWVLQAYIQAKGTQLAQREEENQLRNLEIQVRDLKEELQLSQKWQNDMEVKWMSLVQQLPPDLPSNILPEQINNDELIQILLDFGLSERASHKASVSIRQHFEKV